MKIISIEPSFIIFGSIFVVLNLIKGVSNVLIRYILIKIKYVILQKLTLDTLDKFFDARGFLVTNQGLLINTLNKELTIIGDTVGHFALITSYFFQLLLYLITPMVINYKLTLYYFNNVINFLYPLFILNNIGYRFGQKNTSTANANTQTFTEIFQAAKLIIGFGNQTKAKNRYENTFNAHVNATIKSQTSQQPYYYRATINYICRNNINRFIIDDQINIPELSAVFWSLMGALPLLGKIVHGRISVSNFIPSYEQLNFLRTNAADHKEFSGTKNFESLNDKIEFKNVSFKYPGRYFGLNNCNLLFKKNKNAFAITGKSGSGKTTISDLILGLQKTSKGKVLVDNIEINEYDINKFRHKIGYVPQDSFLFNTSIENNLLWARNDLEKIKKKKNF